MDKSHLSSITSCDAVLHLESPNHSSEPQDTLSVESVEIEFIDESEEPLDNHKLPPTGVFLEHHDYDLLLHNQDFKMTLSCMSPTLATPLHYPNSWHNTTVKTCSPLILQVQYQLPSKPPVITPSTVNVLVT